MQEFGRFRQRLHRIEWVEQAALGGGARHELGDALRLAPPRVSGPTAPVLKRLSPDQPREEVTGNALARAADSSIRQIVSALNPDGSRRGRFPF